MARGPGLLQPLRPKRPPEMLQRGRPASVSPPVKRRGRAPGCARTRTFLPVAVEDLALARVAEHVVGLGDLLELLLSAGLLVLVRVVTQRLTAVGPLDLLVRRTAGQAQRLVIVLSHCPRLRPATQLSPSPGSATAPSRTLYTRPAEASRARQPPPEPSAPPPTRLWPIPVVQAATRDIRGGVVPPTAACARPRPLSLRPGQRFSAARAPGDGGPAHPQRAPIATMFYCFLHPGRPCGPPPVWVNRLRRATPGRGGSGEDTAPSQFSSAAHSCPILCDLTARQASLSITNSRSLL